MRCEPVLVSVIIPVYNGEAFLAEAIASVQRQVHRPLEILIVDDGSTDNTAEIAAGFDDEVRYTFKSNGGPASARNIGLKMACGDVIGFLDVDDLWTEKKLEWQLVRLASTPTLEIILGHTQRMWKPTDKTDSSLDFKLTEPSLALSLGAGLFKKSVFDKMGWFDESLRYCDDWDWFMRAREKGITMITHPEVVLLYRRHDQNMTNETDLGNLHFTRMLKQSLDRRRRQNRGDAKSLPNLSDVNFEGDADGKAEDLTDD